LRLPARRTQLLGASTLLCRDASVTRLPAQNGEDLIEAFTAYERDMIEYGFAVVQV
jgi:hypothetical protein